MSENELQDRLPEIAVRVPGPWRNEDELRTRLPKGFRLEGVRLATPHGRSLDIRTLPADRDFPNVFRIACARRPLSSSESKALDQYRMTVGLMASGGSHAAARNMLQDSACLVEAGGIGVFVDNSVTAHSGGDWRELAEHRKEPLAVFYAYVNIIKLSTTNELISHGMHIFGQRDGIVASVDELSALEDFLRIASAESREFHEGDTFADEQGRQFRLQAESAPTIFSNHPVNNPYGRWRLVAI